MIKNPKYKGPWKAKQIANPNYFEDNHPHNFALMVIFSYKKYLKNIFREELDLNFGV